MQAAEEDFGIALVEALAAGCPVIAYGKGGAREIVIDGKTGLLYAEQTVDGLIGALEQFEAGELKLEESQMTGSVERFSKAIFQQELKILIEDTWTAFEAGENNHW